MDVLDSVVIGAGQAGLSASYHLQRRGIRHLVLDADDAPGGAWQHRWDSLTMRDVHGVAALPDATASPATRVAGPTPLVPAYFADYEREHDLPVVRPVRVDRVDDDGRPARRARRRADAGRPAPWSTPPAPGRSRSCRTTPASRRSRGRQVHTHDYPGAEAFRGLRTVVVGGGASAVQLLGEIALVTDTLWVTRRAPGVAHRRLHARGRPRRGRAGRGPRAPRAAAGQRRRA